MREITAYVCADGRIFEDDAAAKSHEEDLLGKELDGMLRIFGLELPRSQEYRALLCAMKKRGELEKAAVAVLNIIQHGGEE